MLRLILQSVADGLPTLYRILGLDFGSTYTRVTILCPPDNAAEDPEPLLFNVPHPGPARSGVFKIGEWTSTGFPFGAGCPYTGAHVEEGRFGTSLKPGFVIGSDLPLTEKLAQISDYPHARYIAAKLRQNESRSRRYVEAINMLFKELAEAVSAKCQTKGIRITSIGVAIPGHWPWEVQLQYHKMVHQVFSGVLSAITMNDIHFHSETQAMMHYLFRLRLDIFTKRHDSNSKVIVIDFGGQNIVSPENRPA